MKVLTGVVMVVTLAVPAAAQQGGFQAQSPTPSMGAPNVPATNLGMDSFAGAVVRSGDHGPSISEYRARAEQNRAEAFTWANWAKLGPLPAIYAAQIRDHLKADLVDWREGYSVKGSDYKAMAAKWLVALDKLDLAQWAEQRAGWFDARDAWIAAHGGGRPR